MPSEQHEQWKRDLFNHLERKLNGCSGCGIGEDPKDHLPVHKGHQYDPSQQIIWTCEQMHPHKYDLLRGAGSVAMEKYQSAPNSGRCCPDLTVLNIHREPMAFIEIVRSSRPRNAVKVARELGIPIFTILAPDRKTITPGLMPSQPWWDFDPTLPEEDKQQMRFMEQVADELMRRNDRGDSTWSQLDVMRDQDGNIQFASFRGSPPDLSEPTFPRTGNMIVAEQCSWTCEESMEISERHNLMDMQDADAAFNLELQRKLGRIVLRAMSAAENEPAQFVVPIGSEEVHVMISRRPLNPHISPTDPSLLNIREQFAEAVETVRHRHRRDNINPASPDSKPPPDHGDVP